MTTHSSPSMSTAMRPVVQTALILFLASVTLVQAQVFSSGTDQQPDLKNGAKVWSRVCVRCHNLRLPSELSPYDWKVSMTHMRIRAGLTGKDTRDIAAFIIASNTATPNTAASTAGAASGMTGEEIYSSSCAGCHGDDGKGTMSGVPDFTKKDGVLSKPEDILMQNIISGYQSPGNSMAMPPRGGDPDLTDNDLASVLKFLLTRFAR